MNSRAFTMLEMLVAMAATLILVIFLNQIFQSLQAATSMGKGVSVIVQNARTVGPQLTNNRSGDAAKMVGPLQGGFLVVINYVANPPTRPIRLTSESEQPVAAPLRSDQVMWVRDVTTEPIAPNSAYSFNSQSPAAHSRVWFGHGLRTQPDGSDPPLPSGATVPLLGHAGPNQFATDWVLARQELFLDGSLPDPRVVGDGRTYALGANAGATVSYQVNPTGAGPLLLYRGLTDLASTDLAELTGAGGVLVSPSKAAYANIYAYTFAQHRLRINPQPISYESWRIAQKHPVFADRCVSFAVQFAGDYDGVEGLDVDSNNATRWYDLNNLPPGGFAVGFTAGDEPVNQSPLPAAYQANGDRAFVFRNGNPADAKWPMLLRLQYRLIDARGRINGEDGLPGKLFEQVIPVAE